MKKLLFLFVLWCFANAVDAQFVYKIKADSVLITNDSCNAELNLENSTKDTLGFLYNKGNGRTEFRRGLRKLTDSTYLIGTDTLKTSGSNSGNYIKNQTSSDQSASFRISGSGLLKGGISSTTLTGTLNERFGSGALNSFNSSGLANTAIGNNALNALVSGEGNTGLGAYSLALATSGYGQTAIGSSALYNNVSTSGSNTALGYQAIYGATGSTAYANVGIGYRTLYDITTGHHNIAIGEYASLGLTTGISNINIGGNALSGAASYNVAIGTSSLGNSTTGSFNFGLGQQALSALTSGSNNIAIGYYTGASVTDGTSNVFIGGNAGFSNNGSGNIFIGYQSGYSETGSNKLYIDNNTTSTPLVYGDFANDTLRVNGKFHANGPVKLDVGSDAASDMFYRNSSGQLTRLPIGSNGQILTVSSSIPSWGYVDLSNSESFRTSDLTLTANSYDDAVSLTLTAGTWMISGIITVESPDNTSQHVTYKCWDGTSVYQAGEASTMAMGTSTKGYLALPVSTVAVLSGSTTVKISVASTAASIVKATPAHNNSGTTNKASSIKAVRIK